MKLMLVISCIIKQYYALFNFQLLSPNVFREFVDDDEIDKTELAFCFNVLNLMLSQSISLDFSF